MSETASLQEKSLLSVESLKVAFPIRSPLLRRVTGHVQAVRGVSFTLRPGDSLGIVGESGCGKSTLAETIVRLVAPSEGRIVFGDADVTHNSRSGLRDFRREVQIVSQDPFESLDPTMTVRQIIREPLQVHKIGSPETQNQRVEELCFKVGIDSTLLDRRSTTFSGGQRQRIAIARALAPEPRLLVLDEPVSALDTSVQAQILNLLNDLRAQLGIAYILIGHDIAAVRQVADRIGVMYLGKIVEIGDVDDLLASPQHPYSQTLISASLALESGNQSDVDRVKLAAGRVPSPVKPPQGCAFRSRCVRATELCAEHDPELVRLPTGSAAACHHPGQ